jgi:hypothetical protein
MPWHCSSCTGDAAAAAVSSLQVQNIGNKVPICKIECCNRANGTPDSHDPQLEAHNSSASDSVVTSDQHQQCCVNSAGADCTCS